MPVNTAMAEQLGEALGLKMIRDPQTGGLRPTTEAEQRRIAEFKQRHQPKHFTVDSNPNLIKEITPPPPVEEEEPEQTEEEKHNPFEGYLKGIAGHVLDAKNNLAVSLEAARTRLKDRKEILRQIGDEVATIELNIEDMQSKFKKLDETLASIVLLEEQGAAIVDLLPQATYKHAPQEIKWRKPAPDDITICRKADIVKFFDQNKNANWTIPEIVSHMPLVKQEHAKKSLPPALAALVNEGKLTRVATGVYRLDG